MEERKFVTTKHERIVLSENELVVARLIGEARAKVRTYATRNTTSRSMEENETLGAQGELAVAKHLNVWPDLLTAPPTIFRPDCYWRGLKVEVKTTDYPLSTVQLRVNGKRKLADADLYILVTRLEDGRHFAHFVLVGWCWALEILDHTKLVHPTDPKQTPNFVMDNYLLRPMPTIWDETKEV